MDLARADIEGAALLRDLMAREKIKELRARYCWHVARAEARQIADLYVEDGLFEVPGEPERIRFEGRETIHAELCKLTPGLQLPMVTDHIIEIDGDDATGTCTMRNSPMREDGRRWLLIGCYHDRFRCEGGEWRFVERRWFQYTPEFAI